MSTLTNLDIKDAACLHIVHILQYSTSRPTTKSMQTNMVNAPKKNFAPLAQGRYSKLPKRSVQRCHQANAGQSGFEADTVRALQALRSLRSKKKLAAEKQQGTHFLRNEEKEQWIEDYVQRKTAGARKWVEHAKAAVLNEQKDMKYAEIAGLTNREPEKTFQKIMVALGDSLGDLAIPSMGRMKMIRRMKKQSRSYWAKMTNPAGWWAQSPRR